MRLMVASIILVKSKIYLVKIVQLGTGQEVQVKEMIQILWQLIIRDHLETVAMEPLHLGV